MNQKVVLITGGSRGLGAAFVRKLAGQGYTVYFTYSDISNEPQPGENTTPILCNQISDSNVVSCVRRVLDTEGKIDILVNNACPGFEPCDFLETDWRLFQDLIDVNVKGSYLFTREVSRSMKNQGGGRIINVLTAYVLGVPPEKLSFYTTAKYALEGLSKATAVDLGKYGITVNMISPGLMATRLSNFLPARYLEAYRQKHPMKRMTTTEDVAEVLGFLVSDGAQFINGVNIPVCGGETF